MRLKMITTADIEKLAEVLDAEAKVYLTDHTSDYGWSNAVLNLLDCILCLNRRYNSFVVPRVENFRKRNPDIISLESLIQLIEKYPSPLEFSTQELNYKDANRARIIVEVTKYFLTIRDDFKGNGDLEKMHSWAVSAQPGDCWSLNVSGFGLAGFQQLRMLFGAQTCKPDRHIINFVSDVIGKKVNDVQALTLFEQACKLKNLPARDLDYIIWQKRAST